MGTSKDFRVKTGLVVEDGDVTLASDHTVKAGIFDTNVAAAGVTLTGTTLAADGSDTNIDINLTPKGSGEVNITKVDINAGTIDGATIATSDVTVGSGKTLDVSSGTLTLANNQISGNAVEGGTIAATTITALTTAGITASTDIDIGAHDLRASTLTADSMTAARVAFYGTAGVLSGDSDMTFATDTLTVTKLGAYEQAGAVDFSDEAMTNVNIDSGAIDGTTIGANSAGAITGSTITATTSVLGTLGGNVDHGNYNSTNVDINSGAIDGTVIGAASAAAGTFAALTATSLTMTEGAITNVGAISADRITSDAADVGLNIDFTGGDTGLNLISLANNLASALSIGQGSDSYMKFVTTTGSESIILSPEPNSSAICKVVIGDNAAEDTMLVFDGAEIEYRLGIDDSANQFEIGVGEAHDTTPAIVMDNAGNIIQLGQDSSPSSGEVLAYDGSKWTAAASASGADGMGSGFVLEDGDGTELTIDEDKEVKFIDGDGIDINWTDVSTGSDGDPYDLTFSLDIDGMTDIGAGLASGDLFIVDDGAGGTNRKTTVDRIATLFAGTGITASSGVISVDAAQTAATSSMTSSTSRTITTPLLSVESTATTKPVVQIKNTTSDQTGSELRFVKDKGAAGAASDIAGAITFYSDDAAQNNQAFGKIQTKTTAATSGSETGEIGLSVATSGSGALAEVLVITGGAAAATSTVDVKGHLVVRGTTTTVNSTTVDVADININLGNGVGNDAAVDGGGVTLESSDSNKTFNWVDSTDAWTSSEHMNLLSGKAFKIAGTSVLNATTLGSAVVTSSLTTVGALNSGSITSGFGTINTGSSNITTSGTLAGGAITGTSLAVSGTITGDTSLTLDSTTLVTAELGVLDGITTAGGTVTASKALVVDSNRDLATIRNLTSDGTVQGATLSADAVAIIDTARGSGTTITGATSLMNIAKATYRAAKVLYHIKKDSAVDTDAGEILITYNGTNAFLTHYAEVSTGAAVVGTWDATVSGANIEVRFTPTANGAHTYSVVATQLIT